eukprot:TRINITY_DN25969_c0_g1_i1.p1 TRINITY_DN25969_c0_g1~~TRINITY_DN25969_c0_g1_i1.p1  ORF type:complete len:410 (+),score=56.68 TRINITY_DN25969_c0_g1_i1:35-1231(+)
MRGVCPYNSRATCPLFLIDEDHRTSYIHQDKCPYGFSCPFIGTDPSHCLSYTHEPEPPKEIARPTQICQYGMACTYTYDENHSNQYMHYCKYGMFCRLKRSEKREAHIARFIHKYAREPCNDKACKLTDDVHCARFNHSCPDGLQCVVMKDTSLKGKDHLKRYQHPCPIGQTCKDQSVSHRNKFGHDQDILLHLFYPQISASAGSFPSTWTAVTLTNTIPFQTVDIPSSAKEFQDIVNIFTAGGHMNGRYQSVISLARVENRKLWKIYETKKQIMSNPNEKWLFHGCKTREALDAIISRDGFDFRIASRGGSVGAGAYFAVKPSYSDSGYVLKNPDGSKEMIICQVLVGDSVQGKSGLLKPPLNPSTNKLYDSVFNGADMFVVFDIAQAYPTYVLKYK